MCGIAGVYRLGEAPPSAAERDADRALVARMLEVIAYRGPDDRGLESLGRATFGVRRLAIQDVEGGHQPLADAGGRVWAMQNGEIYNYPALAADLRSRHALRTRTDTEVLPALWLERGPDLVHALEGMFAAAVFDTRDERLLLARDPLGVKPLYAAEHAGRLLFASELKCLLCDPDLPRDLDESAIARYLALGFIAGRATPFRSVQKVRPGARVLATPRGWASERWWAWPRFGGRAAAGLRREGIVEELGRRLSESTRAMLLSDRPLGVLLSGGVDSSVLVGSLPEDVRRETRTYAIGFEDGGYHDERMWARKVAGHFGTRHHESVVRLDVAAELPRVMRFFDEPCADPAAVPAHLVARAASADVTVLLSGTGGDELFGGYKRYRLGDWLARLAWLPRGAAAAGERFLGERNLNRRTLTAERFVLARKLLAARSRATPFGAYLSAFEPASPWRWREALERPIRPEDVTAPLWDELLGETGEAPGDLERLAFTTDHLFYLPDDLLLKEDRMTMGASVEGRVPFLDSSLVRFAAELPVELRFAGGESKPLLRDLARRWLPADVATRRKHGFSTPLEDWLRGPLDALVGDLFACEGSGVFRRDVLRRWHSEHRAMRDRSGPLWAALCFELWWREVGQPAARQAVR